MDKYTHRQTYIWERRNIHIERYIGRDIYIEEGDTNIQMGVHMSRKDIHKGTHIRGNIHMEGRTYRGIYIQGYTRVGRGGHTLTNI